ncbi:flagellar protein FliS [Arabiibacter massiliensis]|uniref:flagellar protein FliS n=1 Tax=Arabiibacter massiliensis TaxID=1870985 RepID=UPI001E5531B2|nr:flagellar protein FliS [Arabiibacter massiliensis]
MKKSGKTLGVSKHVVAGIVAVLAVAGAVSAGVFLTQNPSVEDWYDSTASQGQFEGKSKEEIQAALNEEVAKGMMNISIAAVVTFPDGASEGEARIENIAANPMDQKVTITLKDSGEAVYESGALAPDQHIQTIKLSRDLEPGEYAAVATFTGYDRETHKQTGQAAAEITLRIEG